jgi:hypothetical protein
MALFFWPPLHGTLQMCADDTVLTNQRLLEMMNEDLVTIDDWLLQDSLTINVKKTEYILFDSGRTTGSSQPQLAFRDVILRKVDKYEYLGG